MARDSTISTFPPTQGTDINFDRITPAKLDNANENIIGQESQT